MVYAFCISALKPRLTSRGSTKRLKGILRKSFQGIFYHCLENYLAKMSKDCLFKYLLYHYMRRLLDSYARYLLDLQIRCFLGF